MTSSADALAFAELPGNFAGNFAGIAQFEACLLLPELNNHFGHYKSKSGRVVSLVAVVPIYAEEYAMFQRVGASGLLKRLQNQNIDLSFKPGRTNVGLA